MKMTLKQAYRTIHTLGTGTIVELHLQNSEQTFDKHLTSVIARVRWEDDVLYIECINGESTRFSQELCNTVIASVPGILSFVYNDGNHARLVFPTVREQSKAIGKLYFT